MGGTSMDLQGYFRIIWRKRWVIILTILISLIVVAVGTYLTTPVYSAASVLRIATASGGSISYTDYIYTDRLVNTYVKIATSRPVLDELVKRLKLAAPPTVRVEIIANTELINITVEDSNPNTAQTAANTLASILIEQSKSLYSGGGRDPKLILSDQISQLEQELNQARASYDQLVRSSPSNTKAIAASLQSIDLKQQSYATLLSQYEDTRIRDAIRANTISLVEPATTPDKPIRPDRLLNYGLGFLLSAMAGLGLAFVFDHFDETLHTSADIEKVIGMPAIVKIPSTKSGKTFLPLDGYSPYGEAYRRLRAAFLYNIQSSNHRVIMVTSPEPEDGKSTICANLAILLAQAGKKVVLVDGDVNVSRIHQIFNLPNQIGLTSVLSGQIIIKDALQSTQYEGLKVLTSGPFEDGKEVLSQQSKIHELISDLTSFGDLVLIDSPAILSVADVSDLATEVDSVLVVVRRNLTNLSSLDEARKLLDKLDITTMGFIINRAEGTDYGYRYYNARRSAAKKGYPRDIENP
jgi:polysaccharide biosynthesis transport protein